MLLAYRLGQDALPAYSSKRSRKDFTLPQLFACLVVGEHQHCTYRGLEALLCDTQWYKEIGMPRPPDHNTLCRAFHHIVTRAKTARILDLLSEWFKQRHVLGTDAAIDSTLYDTHHRSRHYERRLRHHRQDRKTPADTMRSRTARKTPKLVLAADVSSHAILAAMPKTGMGSDAPDFLPVLKEATGRSRIWCVYADAGYDSEANHQIAREQMGIRSCIKAGVGRRTSKAPSGRYRRMMYHLISGSQKGQPYGRRAQVETVMSMLKRNLGDSLRSRSSKARKMELMLMIITHDLMLYAQLE